MNKSLKNIAISGLSIVALSLIGGCTLSATKEETTRTYVPTPPAPVVAPRPFVEVVPAPDHTITVVPAPQPEAVPEPDAATSSEEERREESSHYNSEPGYNTEEEHSYHHSESTTVEPQ